MRKISFTDPSGLRRVVEIGDDSDNFTYGYRRKDGQSVTAMGSIHDTSPKVTILTETPASPPRASTTGILVVGAKNQEALIVYLLEQLGGALVFSQEEMQEVMNTRKSFQIWKDSFTQNVTIKVSE